MRSSVATTVSFATAHATGRNMGCSNVFTARRCQGRRLAARGVAHTMRRWRSYCAGCRAMSRTVVFT